MKVQTAQLRWERRTQGPLLGMAAAFAVAYALPIVVHDANGTVRLVCTVTEWVVWGAFAVDYVVRLALSPGKWLFVRSHPLDLIAVLVPLLRPLQLLRLVSTLLLVGRRARMAPQIQLTAYVGGTVLGLLMFGSLAVLEVERDAPGGNIKTLGDAVWWSFTTMTTVGYGDHSPTTGLGRVLAVGLMLSGIALLGVVTANIAAWFISRFERDDAEEQRRTALLEALVYEVKELRLEVGRLSGPGVGAGAAGAARAAGAVGAVGAVGASGSAGAAGAVGASGTAEAAGVSGELPVPHVPAQSSPAAAETAGALSSPTS